MTRATHIGGMAAAVFGLTSCGSGVDERHPMPGSEAGRGRDLIVRVGCAACHVIPGIDWPQGKVGPSLEGFAARPLVAGRLRNEPETLARYIRNAPDFTPRSGMPPMPLTEQEARDVAAYLYTLEPR